MEKELRIGNWVNYKGHIVQLCADDFAQLEDDIKTGKIKPIPLDESWLLDFGCKYINGYGYEKSGFKGNIFSCSRWNYHGLRVDIKFVHRFQNLYFELSDGEELIRKQNVSK